MLQSSGSASGPRRHSYQWFAAGALLASSAACAPGALAPPRTEASQLVAGGLPGAVVDLSPMVWKPGLASYDLSVAGQGTRSVVVWVPPEAPEPRVLLVLLHGRTVGKSPLPIYAIAGTKDEQFDFQRVRDAVQLLRDQGGDVTLDAKYRGSHFAMCSYVPELTRAGRWLEQHLFSTGAAPAAIGAGP